jgi:cysteinyl-tRNA synthetase
MAALQLSNTLTRRKEAFVPLDPKRVTMYVCGPTVYSYAHIGNARPAVVFDTLFRVLRRVYGADHVVYARNITDIDDRINGKAHAEGVDISVVAGKFTKIYNDDLAALNVLPPTLEPFATEHIPEIIALAQSLIEKSHAYAAEGHVLFSVASFADYGKLSGRDPEEMLAGARIDVAPYKRDPGDFVLWKPSNADQPGWDSPWGRGRPGWHIECSAMIKKSLGETIDIHGGGLDLTFPHHENEVAQSTCAHDGKLYARVWMHNGMLNMGDTKMSKSIGNVRLIHDLIGQWPGEAMRLALLSAHYRAPLEWTEALLEQSVKTLDRVYGALERVWDAPAPGGSPDVDAFEAALADDLNTPQALAALAALATEANKAKTPERMGEAKAALLVAGGLLGILQMEPQAWFQRGRAIEPDRNEEIQALVDARVAARVAKDWAESDRLRAVLAKQGVEVQDSKDGSTWRWVA